MGQEMTIEKQTEIIISHLVGDATVTKSDGTVVPANHKLVANVREQLESAIAPKLESMQADIQTMREGLAKGPPVKERRVGAPPWDPTMEALGIPDANWYNPDAAGAALDGKWDSFAEFCRSVINRDMKKVPDDRLLNVSTRGEMVAAEQLTGEEIQLGGALVPEEFRPRLLMMALQDTSIRRMATVFPMAKPVLSLPTIRDRSHADGMTFGGVKFQWLEVNTTIPRSRPDFNLVELNARALAGRMELPNTLIEDSFTSVPTLIYNLWRQAVPWIEESVFIRGDGAGKPVGILNAPATIDVPRENNNQFSVADMYAMESRLPPGSRQRAVWVMNMQVLPQLGTLNEDDVQSWHPALSMEMPDRLNGRPVIWNEHASGLGVRGDIMLVDWMYYLIGDLQSLTMAASTHEEFSDHVTVVKGVERIDGKPWIDTDLIPAQRSGTSYTMSPFVVLNTP